MNFYRNFFTVGALTALSRVLGFVRDMLMASLLGTGPAADAFFAAFRFPNLFRRLFAEGAFNAAFVPLFARSLEEDGRDAAYELAGRIVSWLIVFLVVITIAAEIFMPYVLVPFVPGFLDDAEKYDLTVLLTRICFPYLAFMSLMAAYSGILNALGRFIASAAAPILLNVATIAFFIPMLIIGIDDPETAGIWVAIAIIAGGVAQLVLVAAAVKRAHFLPRFKWPKIDQQVRRFWVLAIPAVMAGGIVQINIFVGTIIASAADSAIAYLYYADRLYQLPLGIIGIAVGTVLLPELSRHLKGGRDAEAQASQDRALFVSMLLTMPAAAALVPLAAPVVRLLFERGAFTGASTEATAAALIGFAVGLPAFVLVRVLQPAFFARENTLTPTLYAGISVIVNIGLSLLLFPSLEHVGIAIATSVSAWINALMLAANLARRGQLSLTPRRLGQHGAIVAASGLMALGLWALSVPLGPDFVRENGVLREAIAVGGAVIAGAGFYFAVLHVTGVQRIPELLRNLTRR